MYSVQRMTCAVRSQVAMCECDPILVETCNVRVCGIFRCAKCDFNFACFFITKDTNFISNLNEDFSVDSFYVIMFLCFEN